MWQNKPTTVVLWPSGREFVIDRAPMGQEGYLTDLLRREGEGTSAQSSTASNQSQAPTAPGASSSTNKGTKPKSNVQSGAADSRAVNKNAGNGTSSVPAKSQNVQGTAKARAATQIASSKADAVKNQTSVKSSTQIRTPAPEWKEQIELTKEVSSVIWQRRPIPTPNGQPSAASMGNISSITGRTCPCTSNSAKSVTPAPNLPVVAPGVKRMASSLSYGSIKYAMALYPCLTRSFTSPTLRPAHLSPKAKKTKKTVRFHDKMDDVNSVMFEAMVDEMKDLFCSRGLKNHRKFLEHETKLSPIEMLFKMADVPADDMNNRFYFLIGQIMLRSTYKKQKQVVEEMCQSMLNGDDATKADEPKIDLPKNVLPDVITDKMVDELYQTILLRMDPNNEYVAEWFRSLSNESFGAPLSIPKTSHELISLAAVFFKWARKHKSTFFNGFDWDNGKKKNKGVQKKKKKTKGSKGAGRKGARNVPKAAPRPEHLDSDDYSDEGKKQSSESSNSNERSSEH